MPRILFLALVFCLSTIVVNADPFVITQGSIVNFGPNGFAAFNYNFSGPNFSLLGGSPNIINATAPCALCFAGQSISLGFNTEQLRYHDWSGQLTFNGSTYNLGVQYTPFDGVRGIIFTQTPSVIVPSSNDSVVTLTAPFTMSGNAHLTFSNDPNSPVFSVDFQGSGMATMLLSQFQPGTYLLQRVTYNFAPAAVPEPASVLLLCSRHCWP